MNDGHQQVEERSDNLPPSLVEQLVQAGNDSDFPLIFHRFSHFNLVFWAIFVFFFYRQARAWLAVQGPRRQLFFVTAAASTEKFSGREEESIWAGSLQGPQSSSPPHHRPGLNTNLKTVWTLVRDRKGWKVACINVSSRKWCDSESSGTVNTNIMENTIER